MELTALQHSSFLQSLGWAIANSLWQCAVLWVAYHVVLGIYKSASAKFKTNYSTVLLFSAFTWFCVTLFQKYTLVSGAQPAIVPDIQTSSIASAPLNYKVELFLKQLATSLPYLSAAYLLLLLCLAVRLINSYRNTHFIKVNGLQKPGVEWRLFTDKISKQMDIARSVKLWVSEHVDVPATIGYIKPVILIPLASVNQLSSEQMEAIILHELSHIKRNDYLINLFVSLIETILFFNPFVVLLAKIIKRERENCCDDFVIQYQYDRHSYASALLSLEQLRIMSLPFAVTATSGKKQLLHRVKRIMEAKNSNNLNYGQKLIALVIVTCALCSIAWLAPQKSTAKQSNSISKLFPSKKLHSGDQLNNSFKAESGKANVAMTVLVKNILHDVLTSAPTRKLEKSLSNLTPPVIAFAKEPKTNDLIASTRSLFDKRQMPTTWITRANGGNIFTQTVPVNPVEFERLIPGKTEMKQLQALIEKQKLFTVVDVQKLQNEIDKSVNRTQWSAAHEQFYDKQLKERLTKASNIEAKDLEERSANEMQMYLQHGRTIPASRTRTYYKADSINRRQVVIVDGKIMELVDEEIGSENEGQITKPRSFYFQFKTDTDDNDKPVRIIRPSQAPPTPPSTNDVKIRYRNGVIVINGKEIKTPDVNKLLAQAAVKKSFRKAISKIEEISFN